MKSEQIYQHLLDVAEKVHIHVSEENLRRSGGVTAKSGLCRVHGKDIFIMDKKATVREKVSLLAACLAQWTLDDIYIVPTVRDVIATHQKNRSAGPDGSDADSPDTEGGSDSGEDS